MTGDYPFMDPVDGRVLTGLSREKSAEVSAVCKAVTGRTGTKASFNVVARRVLFHYGDEPFGGPLAIELFKMANTTACIDGMVGWINLGKMSRDAKDRIAAENERAEKQNWEAMGQKFREDIRVDASKHAAFLDRKRRGVGTLVLSL